MADILRDPVFVSGRRDRPGIGSPLSVPNLLLTTLAVVAVALPVGQARCESAPQSRQIYADTSRGMPLELRGVAAAPFANLTFAVPSRGAILPDTSQGQPLTLRTLAAPAPFANPQWTSGAAKLNVNSDTSQGQSFALRTLVVATAPFANPQWTSPELRRTNADTSQGAYALRFAPAALPIGQASFVALPHNRWQPSDTSSSAYPLIQPIAVVPLPPGATTWVALPKLRWPNIDTSRSTPVQFFPAVVPTSGEYAYTFIGV